MDERYEVAPEPAVSEPLHDLQPVQEFEPIGQGQPVPYDVPVAEAEPQVQQPIMVSEPMPFASASRSRLVALGCGRTGCLVRRPERDLHVP